MKQCILIAAYAKNKTLIYICISPHFVVLCENVSANDLETEKKVYGRRFSMDAHKLDWYQ